MDGKKAGGFFSWLRDSAKQRIRSLTPPETTFAPDPSTLQQGRSRSFSDGDLEKHSYDSPDKNKPLDFSSLRRSDIQACVKDWARDSELISINMTPVKKFFMDKNFDVTKSEAPDVLTSIWQERILKELEGRLLSIITAHMHKIYLVIWVLKMNNWKKG